MAARKNIPVANNGLGTQADLNANRALSGEPRPHICGNCRNPFHPYGREDCPKNRRTP